VRPALKAGLLPVWRDRDTLQLGVDPRRAIALSGLGQAAGVISLLDGSRDREAVIAAAQTYGIAAEAASRVLAMLAAAGVLDDFPAIHAFCLEEDVRLRTFVESIDDAALNEPWGTRPDFTRPRWLVIAHVVNHGTQHRSEVARYLTECGHSPGDLDLLDALELPWPGAG